MNGDTATAPAFTQPPYFESLAEAVCRAGVGHDRCSLLLKAESSHFIRFNRAAVRQATQVDQGHVTLAVTRQTRRMESRMALSGDLRADTKRLLGERDDLARCLDQVAADPHLLLPELASKSVRHDSGTLPEPAALVRQVAEAAAGLDFVGFYAGGPVVRAFADSLGTRHWHRVETFHVEWCLYLRDDRAVKGRYGGAHWSAQEFTRRVVEAAGRLALLALPQRALVPGVYRAYLAPAAMGAVLEVLGWAGFGAKERRTGTSSLVRLDRGDAALHPDIHLSEDTAGGLAPGFTADGFVRPATVSLVTAGKAAGTLNSTRSAREFGLTANGANSREVPESLSLAPGGLAAGQVFETLGEGLYIANLWYLNYSDRPQCRMTGMTRFACLWVQEGRPVAPVGVMRFDDSVLRMFGTGLLGLTREAELIADGSTYQERQLASTSTPGALIEDWRLTL
jgi:predicted Zn-dependent protease